MSKCYCERCEGAEQITATEEFSGKDDYMEKKPPSIYERLDALHKKLPSTTLMNELAEVMDAVNSLDTRLVEIALTTEDKRTTEEILEIQHILY